MTDRAQTIVFLLERQISEISRHIAKHDQARLAEAQCPAAEEQTLRAHCGARKVMSDYRINAGVFASLLFTSMLLLVLAARFAHLLAVDQLALVIVAGILAIQQLVSAYRNRATALQIIMTAVEIAKEREASVLAREP